MNAAMSRPETTRPHDWVHRLIDFAKDACTRPFAWGSNDCVHFALRWHKTLTERDVLAEAAVLGERLEYSDALGAMRVMQRFADMQTIGEAAFGDPMPNPMFAQRGDILLVKCAGIEHFEGLAFVVLDQGSMLGPGAEGMIALPFDPECVVAAWSI